MTDLFSESINKLTNKYSKKSNFILTGETSIQTYFID